MADNPKPNPRREYYLRNFVKGTPVCPYQHDHPAGEGYEDCVTAYENAKARLAKDKSEKP